VNKTTRKYKRAMLDAAVIVAILACSGCTINAGSQDATQISNLATFGFDFLRQILAALLT